MKIILTGGGTGGHFYPIIAIAEKLNHYVKILKYDVWYETNHYFTNKRIAMMREVLSFLNE